MTKEINGYVSDLPEGCITETDIFTETGVLLCPKMTLIDERLLHSLRAYKGKIHVTVTYMDIPVNTEIETDESLDFSESMKAYALENITTICANVDNPQVLTDSVTNMSNEISNVIHNSKSLGINLSKLKISDEYTYKHSVDVGTISGLIAAKMGESEQFIHDVTMAGILHDIGKEKIPLEIINKPDKLNDIEFKIIKMHPVYGYQILSQCHDISEEIRQGVLNHHENMDSSGYPRHLDMGKIGKMGQILAIADVFDALTTARPYKTAKTPAQSIEIMFSMMNKFNITIFKTFLDIVTAYPNGSTVHLNGGLAGTVIRQNKSYPLRPVVQVGNDIIDLSNDMRYLSTIIVE